jgi:hypothetical protein
VKFAWKYSRCSKHRRRNQKNALLSAENAEKKCKTFRQSTYLQEARMSDNMLKMHVKLKRK